MSLPNENNVSVVFPYVSLVGAPQPSPVLSILLSNFVASVPVIPRAATVAANPCAVDSPSNAPPEIVPSPARLVYVTPGV